MRALFTFLLLGLFSSLSFAQNQPPNIVLILADDLGFSDTQPYGGEINTPTINDLAKQGVSFTNYHTGASCAPSRSMLLTGVDSHRNGVPNIPEAIPPQQSKHENYKGTLGHNVVTVASLLQDSGYHTYMAGKWHLGNSSDLLPYNRGFDRTVAMADTGSDNWEQKPYLPIYKKANWTADGKEFQLPEDYYSSKFLVDKTIEFIDSNADDKQPFFAYIPFLAVHLPVQAPKEYTERYMETYKEGWSALRKLRQSKTKELGLVPQDSQMVEMHTTDDWEAQSDDMKRYHAKRMAVYAGMVEAMDFNMGRLVKHLKDTGQYDNTIFIFTSDNGSEASGSGNPTGVLSRWALARQGYNNEYETLGEKGSFNNIGASFASAAASPLSYYKFFAGEGGLRVPLIISGKGIAEKNRYSKAFTYVTDITPTILEMSGISAPVETYGGRHIEAMIGKSLTPITTGEADTVYGKKENIGYELAGNAALFQGDFKIVKNLAPTGDGDWHLFNIVTDPGETTDLKETMVERFNEMVAAYDQYALDNNVQALPVGYRQRAQVALNGIRDRFGPQIALMVVFILSLLGFYKAYRVSRKRA